MKSNQLHITVLVSNDLQHDQRVAKVCGTLLEMGFEVTLVGRRIKSSMELERPYRLRRFRLLFNKGSLFYAALNLRMFFYLLIKRSDIILANDLDTLLPAFVISRLKNIRLVYDSHEYFTEAEGLTGRNFQKNIWLKIERMIFPKLKSAYTVNESIAGIYRNLYNVDVRVVRNIPLLDPLKTTKTRRELNLPENKKIILLQGAFIDPDRGGMELIQAMQYLNDVLLLIIGAGRDVDNMKVLIRQLNLNEKVMMMDKLPFNELRQYTANVDLGLSLDKPLHLNYTYSLPNKLFDYIHAGTPVLVSDLPELRRIVSEYGVGAIASTVEPAALAASIKSALSDPYYEQWKLNCVAAKDKLNWQNESTILKEIFSNP